MGLRQRLRCLLLTRSSQLLNHLLLIRLPLLCLLLTQLLRRLLLGRGHALLRLLLLPLLPEGTRRQRFAGGMVRRGFKRCGWRGS